ncbi:hypothetical protein LPB90_20200 [Chryseobacterium sp. LC2016-29]|uniref:DUF6705 family protein n=1 Tax=Chryseobacterium sp. LC2016-29 TaxID=2897331 RepID=UPI001E34926D|nr:DUF6705 family protein [Chryseobacterium sp. LC2016-29]MCD0480772.1 hypothetical protein [Chryseobacterium sp. LC2016-29]
MKNIINLISIILCISFNNCTAQNNYHRPDPYADKFAGIWKWGDTNNGLVLIMKKENNVNLLGDDDQDIFDIIIGFHKIYKNGVATEDNTMYSNTSFNDKKRSIKAVTDNNNSDVLTAFMTHKNKGIIMKIQYIDSTHIKIIEVENKEGVRFKLPGQSPTDWSIDIPNNIILTKQ